MADEFTPNDEFHGAVSFANNKHRNKVPLATQGQLLRVSFLSGDIVDLLERTLQQNSEFTDTDSRLIDAGIAFLDNLGQAWAFLYGPESHLLPVPNSDALETLDRLHEANPSLLTDSVAPSKDSIAILKTLLQNRTVLNTEIRKRVEILQDFFRLVQSTALTQLEVSQETGLYSQFSISESER